jgi:DNA polymerase elongation subunit (family B)
MRECDPDIVTGWNIFGFDLEYLVKRMQIAKCKPESYVWGRHKEMTVELVEKKLASGALGSNILKMVPMTGRYVFDLFHDVKREHKLESYSLNNVSKTFLKNEQKNDMPVKEIFSRFADGDPVKLAEVAEYCIQDTVLPHLIMEKLYTIQNLVEMAKATWVPLSYLSERGQQIKVFSQIARKARELGFLIPTLPYKKSEETEKFEGATVLEAQTGAYYTPITALDFEGLYPSIMVAHNLCYSSIVLNEKYDNLPGITYEQYGDFRFAQNVPSLLPEILKELKAFRKKAKADMKRAAGTPLEAIYNGRQLSYKISMNSVYGFTGATGGGMLPMVQIASTVTRRGRQMIEETKNYIETHFEGAKVRYGDSVMPETPVLVKMNGVFGPMKIENLATQWESYPGFLKEGTDKESSEIEGVEAWTHEGWQPIKRVIRHKCAKRIYRVLTHTGIVDVTEDHSLLGSSKELLKPKDVMVGQKLLHSFPTSVDMENTKSLDALFVIGMFVGDGSCGSYHCPSGRKSTWCINNQDLDLLDKCKTILETMYPDYGFVIMDTLQSSGVYKLGPRGNVVKLVSEWREWCYDGQAKKIPEFVFSNYEAKKAFLDGLWASDGCRRDNETGGCHRIDTKNQVTAQWYYLLLTSMNYKVSLNTRADKTHVFRLTWTESSFRKDPTAIKKISILHESWDGYVYDLETEAGTFQAGVGQMIVKNTDSVMVEFDTQGMSDKDAIAYAWEQGEKAAEQCTKLFKAPNNLELEKVYCPYFLYSKKRYAAKMYEKVGAEIVFQKIDVKGLQVVRRDNCPYVREVCQKILGHILNSPDPLPAISEAKKCARLLLDGKVPMEKLMLSKQLSSDYKSQNHAHLAVRDKIQKRAPGSEPKQGDRVQYVIVEGPKKAKLYEKSEDPGYVRQNGIKLDYNYYFTNQLKNPVCDLLEPLIGDANIF